MHEVSECLCLHCTGLFVPLPLLPRCLLWCLCVCVVINDRLAYPHFTRQADKTAAAATTKVVVGVVLCVCAVIGHCKPSGALLHSFSPFLSLSHFLCPAAPIWPSRFRSRAAGETAKAIHDLHFLLLLLLQHGQL